MYLFIACCPHIQPTKPIEYPEMVRTCDLCQISWMTGWIADITPPSTSENEDDFRSVEAKVFIFSWKDPQSSVWSTKALLSLCVFFQIKEKQNTYKTSFEMYFQLSFKGNIYQFDANSCFILFCPFFIQLNTYFGENFKWEKSPYFYF